MPIVDGSLQFPTGIEGLKTFINERVVLYTWSIKQGLKPNPKKTFCNAVLLIEIFLEILHMLIKHLNVINYCEIKDSLDMISFKTL